MIEQIKDNYKMEVEEYRDYQEGIIFFYNGYYYLYTKCYIDENQIISLISFTNKLKEKNIKLHSFIYNKRNEFITNSFVMMRINNFIYDINFEDLNKFYNISLEEYKLDYKFMDEVWERKIDYLETQLKELNKNIIINHSFDYFLGIVEILIKYLKNNYDKNKVKIVLSHQTVKNMNSIDFYNPLNISYDNALKDYSSYIKYNQDENAFIKIIDRLDRNSQIYLFVRMIFPFEYFEIVENVVLKNKGEEQLINIINNINKYEKKVGEIEKYFGIYIFDWIKV